MQDKFFENSIGIVPLVIDSSFTYFRTSNFQE